MGNQQSQYNNIFVDDSAKNGVGLPGVFCHTPTHPKVDGKYLTFAETVSVNIQAQLNGSIRQNCVFQIVVLLYTQ